MDKFVNKEKLARAEAEAHITGGDITEIYTRIGGLLKAASEKPVESVEVVSNVTEDGAAEPKKTTRKAIKK